MIFITGDTHGDFTRFSSENFPEQKRMNKEDFVIICGDFGGLWDGTRKEHYWLDWLENKPFTTLFVSGNHENYDLLSTLCGRTVARRKGAVSPSLGDSPDAGSGF
ncbi:metallophosphoesterase family protein [Bittarella massiliensis (ex Durand et al. 2017)]|uniref:metallophosphoesterase family protein n=1 Tax=Bittarella massiliensis (ex Durand et al. 2017) TaxID=1720313 RepID=UPI0034A0946B